MQPRSRRRLPVLPRMLSWYGSRWTPLVAGQWHARYDGQEVRVGSRRAFATTVLDLRRSMEMWNRGPFDYLHYYVARSLLARVAAENDPLGGLHSSRSILRR